LNLVATTGSLPNVRPVKVTKTTNALLDNSIDAVLARLVARDGLSFNVIKKSDDLRRAIDALMKELQMTERLPLSDKTIKERVETYGKKIKAVIKEAISSAHACPCSTKSGSFIPFNFLRSYTRLRNRINGCLLMQTSGLLSVTAATSTLQSSPRGLITGMLG